MDKSIQSEPIEVLGRLVSYADIETAKAPQQVRWTLCQCCCLRASNYKNPPSKRLGHC
jgi:hypothetical protein